MRPYGTPQQLEQRRRRAIQLMRRGHNLPTTAATVKASVSSVFRWWHIYQRQGMTGLRPLPAPGRPARLSLVQKRRLIRRLLQGPLAAGYATELWTLERIGRVIEKHYRVTYHPAHVWKLLRALGWSCQKPERRALQRDEAAIAHWKRYRWPHIKKRRSAWGAPGVPRREWLPAHSES
jgi:transposase